MRRVRVTGPARRDIARALKTSSETFGQQMLARYLRLLDQALRDLGKDPARIGVKGIDDIREGYFTYHLRSSVRSGKLSIRRPRHLIAFYADDSGDVIIARVFHERQMLARHIADDLER